MLRTLAPFLFGGVALIAWVVLFASAPGTHALPTGAPGQQLAIAFSKDVDAMGPVRAYALFKKEYANETYGEKHRAAHVFGSTLYQEKGLPALVACDSDFAFGCYHGFFAEAIASEGLAIIPALDAGCNAATSFTGCQHGIGHGVMGYFGADKLTEALEACLLTKQVTLIAGCTSGLFMEYNMPSSEGAVAASEVSSRPFDPEHPYDPCGSIAGRFRQSCYHELPQWWMKSGITDAAQIGKWCGGADTSDDALVCVMGYGTLLPERVGYDADRVIQSCGLMPAAYRSRCYAEAANALGTIFNRMESALTVCARVDSGHEKECNLGAV